MRGVRKVCVAAAIALAAVWLPASFGVSPFGARAQGQAGAASAAVAAIQEGAAVRTIPSGVNIGTPPGKKGDTWYWLEGQTSRITARYGNTTIVSQRNGAGDIKSSVFDNSGNEVARLNANSITVSLQAAESFMALNDSGERPALDWASRQAYALHAGGTNGVAWRNGILRRSELDLEPNTLDTEWANGLRAKLTRLTVRKHTITETVTKRQHVFSGEAYSTTLYKDGEPIGQSLYFVRDKVFMYKVPGDESYITPDSPVHQGKGWPFTPDTAWVNLQTIASYHFRSLIKENGFVAKRHERPQGLIGRVWNFFEPALRADDPGCNGLHWLDGTTYRVCCDVHDYCYAKYGCSQSSWWQWWKSWSCDFCNMNVVMCFAEQACSCFPGDARMPIEETPRT